ncbi:MAG TPA: hypothetical protein P5571_00645 [Candidatus Krumholzibacteria bacterium]|nr:hypothetical protein [Candidatus Krumholzibacteria bacterium]HRX49862.1 hypothetical protein [Candidatus Krumholzibacteria bacterium]
MNVRNLLTGCGAGCLLTLVVAAVVGALVFREVKDSFDRFESVADLQARLLEEHGSVADYVPPADGVIPAERLETYLRVQADVKPAADSLETRARILRDLEEGDGATPGKILRAVKGVRSLGDAMGRLLEARDTALLEHGMGLGEYTYLTELVTHGWLGRPLRAELGKDPNHERTRLLREVLRGLLERQREAALAAGDPNVLVPALDSELDALDADLHYVPWSRGLPAATESSLTPYRDRLEPLATDSALAISYGLEGEANGITYDF